MFKAYLKYLLLYLVLGWLAAVVQVYMVMEPFEIYPRYYIVPLVFVAIAALFPAWAEAKAKEQSEDPKPMPKERPKPVAPPVCYKKDALTGALLKDAFNEICGIKIIEAKHLNEPLSLVIFDIDHFKKINDTHGHLQGDEVLRELSRIVRDNIRQKEYFVRWGGEEFVLLLPGTGLQGAKMVAEKIRRIVESTPFSIGKVTCSFGVTTLKKDDTIQSFLHRADEALYEAKESGRNQVKVRT